MCTDWGVQVIRDQLYYVVLYIVLWSLYIDKLLDVADTGFDYLIVFMFSSNSLVIMNRNYHAADLQFIPNQINMYWLGR